MTLTLKLTVCYDGTEYCGWQVQPNGVTVQGMIELAFRRVTGTDVRVTASGRTDSGVHAIGQVASCQVNTRLTPADLLRALNANLPVDIRILDVAEVAKDFHAIRSAVRKRYRYVIFNGAIMDPFLRRYAWYIPMPLDDDAMREAARPLVGRHDFTSFESSHSPRATSVRTVHQLTVRRQAEEMGDQIMIEIEADGFLYNMARNLVGTLVEVGRGAQPVNWPEQVLAAHDRKKAGPTAPPHGLFLVQVQYRRPL